MLLMVKQWGPQGKPDLGNTPKVLKAEINSLVQKQISAAMKSQTGASNAKISNDSNKMKPIYVITLKKIDHLKSKCPQLKKSNGSSAPLANKKPCAPKAPWKTLPPSLHQ